MVAGGEKLEAKFGLINFALLILIVLRGSFHRARTAAARSWGGSMYLWFEQNLAVLSCATYTQSHTPHLSRANLADIVHTSHVQAHTTNFALPLPRLHGLH